jgi:predicted phosphodiesterase
MLRIGFTSDVHLECGNYSERMGVFDIEPCHVFILCGDILEIQMLNKPAYREAMLDFFQYGLDRHGLVVWVPGNHEYYNTDYIPMGELKQVAKSIEGELGNCFKFISNNAEFVDIENTRLIFSTLWTQIHESGEFISRRMYDYQYIISDRMPEFGSDPCQIEVEEITHLSIAASKAIRNVSNNIKDKALICFTHHVPTYAVAPPSGYDPFRYAYYNEYDWLVNRFSAWVFGHTHIKTDKMVGNTLLLSNPVGCNLAATKWSAMVITVSDSGKVSLENTEKSLFY